MSNRWSAFAELVVRRRRVALGVWAVVAAALVPLARGVERRLETGTRVRGSESAQVSELLATRFASPYAQYAVLVVRGLPPPATEAGRAALGEIVRVLRASPAVTGTFSALDVPDTLFVGPGGGTFVIVGLRASTQAAVDTVLPPLRATTAAVRSALRARHGGVELLWTGEGPLTTDLRRASADDASAAERRVLPLTLALLVLSFGAVVAAALPVAAGALAIALALGCTALVAQFAPLSVLVINVATMLGLGLGIDYALLLVSRFREARGRGLEPDAAAIEAATYAGHSIVLSGAAVAVGLAALTAVPLTDLRSIAVGGLIVTTISVLVATTLLPGALVTLGRWVELGRGRELTGGRDTWGRWSAWVVRRPLLVLLLAGAPLAVLGWEWTRLDVRTPSGDWLPSDIESARGLRTLREMHRSGVVQSVRVVVQLPAGTSAFTPAGWQAAVATTERLSAERGIARVRSLPTVLGSAPSAVALTMLPRAARASLVSADNRYLLFELIPGDSATVVDVMDLVRSLRQANPEAVTGLAGARLLVGGLPAFNVDYGDAVRAATPRVVGLVVVGTFLALLIGFRSVLVPLKAVLLNLISVGAAFGAAVLVFQDGYGARLLGLEGPLDGIFPAVPLLVFCTVFGLSMDYEVFLVARVAEARRRGADDADAVVEGVRQTGGVITSAALIMTVVFGAFMLGDFVLMKILGFALATAVLIDVTIVRLALGPALLALAGRWNWWPGATPRATRSGGRDPSGEYSVSQLPVRQSLTH
ncbi:MAG: MMPL family transporter [Gemmatimonadota bacterium]|nr:MMPL family transporter [Gemmatimonadota bacterium]